MRETVAVDLDGVLADYSRGWISLQDIGDPMPGAVEFTLRLSEKYDVLIYTTRCKEDMPDRSGLKAEELRSLVQKWLDRYGFAYQDIYTGQGKPIASAYVDDRAVKVPTNPSPDDFERALEKVHKLCKK